MKRDTVYLDDDMRSSDASEGRLPRLDVYLSDEAKEAPALVIFPGGAYHHRAEHEGKDVAICFVEKGFHAFVVQYRVAPNSYPAPFLDAVSAMNHIKANAGRYGIKKGAIAVCGFSAGAHLAASLGIFPGDSHAGISPEAMASARPDAMILCYPVVSSEEYTHEGSIANLLGDDSPAPEMRRKFSWFRHVGEKTPPTFLWHTSDDAPVPVENSLLLADALKKHSVPFEMHIFPNGAHGLGLAVQNPRISQWPKLAESWLKERFTN